MHKCQAGLGDMPVLSIITWIFQYCFFVSNLTFIYTNSDRDYMSDVVPKRRIKRLYIPALAGTL